jgi:TonB-dependent SusC/RagA subfamily outer membrane receptor
MKNYFTILLLLITSIGFSQDFKPEWEKVIRFELDGRIKSAQEVVEKIYKKANRKKVEDQIIKCFFYQSKFLQVNDESYQTKVIQNLKEEIADSKKSKKAILNYIYISILESYYQNYRYDINKRTVVKNNKSKDFKTWTSLDFQNEINKTYSVLLKDEDDLHLTNIKNFESIFEISSYTDTKNVTIYDFLQEKIINHYFENSYSLNNDRYKNIYPELVKDSNEFIKFKTDTLSDDALKKIIKTYQNNEKYCLKNNPISVHLLQYNRMKKFYNYINNKEYYFAELTKLEAKTKNMYLLQDIKVDFAQHYYSLTYKNSKINYYPEVLTMIDTILNRRDNPNAKAEAETLKERILKKEITLNIANELYPNQNYRAFVQYKNVDTLKVSYYKIPIDIYKKLNYDYRYYRATSLKQIDKDSLVIDYIEKNMALKSTLKTLPLKTDHFEYTTEVLMDTLNTGTYLVFFETKNPYYKTEKAFAYKTIQVSAIDYVQERNGDYDSFYLLNRKTGQPIENAKVKNDYEAKYSSKIGRVNFDVLPNHSGQNSFSELFFIKEKDTLYSSYYKNTKFNIENESFDAKAMILFDRAIYRPGQKVFFKGFMFQNKNNVKSVVPSLTVHVIINDANEDEVKTFDVQTNEFGSFTGEYDIPKNVLTGEFSVIIEEPDDIEVDTKYYNKKEDEHSFWDNVNYDDYKEFRFKVEEYKRPTFEITFDEIKENYTIGDSITIKGNAKTLAGSNLTNAKVDYTISKSIRLKRDYFNNDINQINSETTTDENGNFELKFVATKDSIITTDIETLNFSIKTEITDLNGETRTANSSVIVGDKMLKLSCYVNPVLLQEEKNTLQVKATTLNNFPLNTTGTITFYKKNQKEFLIKKVNYPELNAIERSEYEKLFPYEAYEQKDDEIIEKKVKTIPFDTEKSKVVDLSFLNDFNLGNYKIVIEAIDQKGNEITTESYFELNSKKKTVSKKTFFTFNQIQSDKNNFVFEILSTIPDLYITTRMFEDAKKDSETVIQLKNGIGIVKIPKKNNYEGDVQFHFSTFWENQYFSNTETISKAEIETKLDFEVISMRNKIEPGSVESWSFLVKNSKLQAEVLASMYDTSLDQFATTTWRKEDFYNYKPSPNIIYRNTYWHNNQVRFNNLHFSSKYYKTYNLNPELNWFGFYFNNKNNYVNEQYLKRVTTIVNVPKNAKMVYGVVSDKNGPIPGANVVVKGTKRGTQTDFDGAYQIEVEKGETLVFSFIGYENTSITYEKEKNINVTFEESSEHLDEVVVVGYGVLKKEALTGSVTSIVEEDNSIDFNYYRGNLSSLNGQIAGLNVKYDTLSNGKAALLIRGTSSLSPNTQPLIVVDGVPMTQEEFSKINPDDIQTLSVLIDAKATALYGSRGANGVVIINTKNGMKALEQVKTRTNFNETAFFYPNLTTDSKGNINISFTSPESLTKWRLRLFAHNKKAETGYFQTDIISQKDIMVMPNMPRFVREKDVINLATKVVNMTNETKSGNAILLLYDAATNTAIDTITMNKNYVKLFNCKPKQSVVVNWTITIPEGVQGLRYKVIAKSGTTSDGEENILPVLTDKILITESIPIWVKGNTKREFTFNNLKNNTSTTLQNHAVTFEYTSNPVWIALQSLPYLMTYEHDCAEQTFAKYYANCIAEKIISSNSKIEKLFQKWHDDKIIESKLKMNEELKSIVLAETPWLLDAESDEEKNKRLAVLMDLNTLKENNATTFKKLEDKMLPTGGFPWFSGGNEDRYISQHILSGIGHLNTLFPEDSLKYKSIVEKGIPNLDSKFVSTYDRKSKIIRLSTVNLNYLYTRSFYLKNYPLTKKCDSIIQLQLKQCKEGWLSYSLYEKGILALIMHRFKENEFAKKIITNLKETVSNNDEIGMYWIENTSGYGWYQSSIETQALLIEAFAEIDKDKETIDAMKVWLIKNKQTNRWPTTKSTTEAVYALISKGSDWVSLKENTKIKIGDEKLLTKKLLQKDDEQQTGYLKIQFKADEISSKMGTISVDNKTTAPGFGGVYWQYFETLENIKKDSTQTISIDKKVFKKAKNSKGDELISVDNETIQVGDLLTIRMIIKTDTDLEFVHLKDLRASCLEPVDVLSGYQWKGNYSYYKSTKDASTNFFFDRLNKGTYVLEYDLRVTNLGSFNNGISTLQSMYAPEYSSHSENTKLIIKE